MANQLMRRHSTSSVISSMQLEPTRSSTPHPLGRLDQCWRGRGESRTFTHCWRGVKLRGTLQNGLTVPQNIKYRVLVSPSNPTSWFLPQRHESKSPPKNWYLNDHRNVIRNSQKVNKCSTDRKIKCHISTQ